MNKLRLGLIGVGAVVREIYRHLYFASAYSDLLSIEAVADPQADLRQEFCDEHGIGPDRRFDDYERMIEQVELDAVAVNTPDRLHEAPTIFALERGLDVLLAKPLTDRIASAHRIIDAARRSGRLIGVDFHKRHDPRMIEAERRYAAGEYGVFQTAFWHMTDTLYVADPNHEPRFFATPDFAERNSPISFLTVHMADAMMRIADIKPVRVRTVGYRQKLPSLTPQPVDGYDLCDTEVHFDGGGVAHILAGWHLPNTAHAITVQGAHIVCTDGTIELGLDAYGYRDTTDQGIHQRSPLFLCPQADGTVSGYGLSYPGHLLEKMAQHRRGELPADERERMMDARELGFDATVVCHAAELSLERGAATSNGVVHGVDVDVPALIGEQLDRDAGAGP